MALPFPWHSSKRLDRDGLRQLGGSLVIAGAGTACRGPHRELAAGACRPFRPTGPSAAAFTHQHKLVLSATSLAMTVPSDGAAAPPPPPLGWWASFKAAGAAWAAGMQGACFACALSCPTSNMCLPQPLARLPSNCCSQAVEAGGAGAALCHPGDPLLACAARTLPLLPCSRHGWFRSCTRNSRTSANCPTNPEPARWLAAPPRGAAGAGM